MSTRRVELAPLVDDRARLSVSSLCLGRSYYRARDPRRGAAMRLIHASPRAPSSLRPERAGSASAILDVFHGARAPQTRSSTAPSTTKLLDAGHYLGSVSTLYRVHASMSLRRAPDACTPSETHGAAMPSRSCWPPPGPRAAFAVVGSITKLKGPAKWVHYRTSTSSCDVIQLRYVRGMDAR